MFNNDDQGYDFGPQDANDMGQYHEERVEDVEMMRGLAMQTGEPSNYSSASLPWNTSRSSQGNIEHFKLILLKI
jgi:hypothetical protein